MIFSKSKLLLTFVTVSLNLHIHICKTINNNANNCQKDVEEYIESPNTDGEEFVKKLYFEMTITEMKSHYAKLYFYDVLQCIIIDQCLEDPITFCYNEYKLDNACTGALKKVNFRDSYEKNQTIPEMYFDVFFLFYKKESLQNTYISEYMEHLYSTTKLIRSPQVPRDFCLKKISDIVYSCKKNIALDFSDCEKYKNDLDYTNEILQQKEKYHMLFTDSMYYKHITMDLTDCKNDKNDLDYTKHILQHKKKNDMLSKYGKLFYIELRDRIQGVKGGYKRLKEFCNDKGSECKQQLANAGYKVDFDYRSYLLHTYNYVAVQHSVRNSEQYLYDFVLTVMDNFQLKNPNANVKSFCERIVNHELGLKVVSTLEV